MEREREGERGRVRQRGKERERKREERGRREGEREREREGERERERERERGREGEEGEGGRRERKREGGEKDMNTATPSCKTYRSLSHAHTGTENEWTYKTAEDGAVGASQEHVLLAGNVDALVQRVGVVVAVEKGLDLSRRHLQSRATKEGSA